MNILGTDDANIMQILWKYDGNIMTIRANNIQMRFKE